MATFGGPARGSRHLGDFSIARGTGGIKPSQSADGKVRQGFCTIAPVYIKMETPKLIPREMMTKIMDKKSKCAGLHVAGAQLSPFAQRSFGGCRPPAELFSAKDRRCAAPPLFVCWVSTRHSQSPGGAQAVSSIDHPTPQSCGLPSPPSQTTGSSSESFWGPPLPRATFSGQVSEYR